MVIIPRQEQQKAIASLNTGTKTIARKTTDSPPSHRPNATVRYELPTGTTVWLTPEQFRQTQGDLIPVDAELAHPYVPLLFRYWTNECMSPLTDKGFKAGRFATTIIPPPGIPSLENFPWSCAAQHLNRDPKIASPCKARRSILQAKIFAKNKLQSSLPAIISFGCKFLCNSFLCKR